MEFTLGELLDVDFYFHQIKRGRFFEGYWPGTVQSIFVGIFLGVFLMFPLVKHPRTSHWILAASVLEGHQIKNSEDYLGNQILQGMFVVKNLV